MFRVHSLPRNLSSSEVDLRHKNHQIRLSVVRDLARSGDESERAQRIALLTACLGDENAEVRRQVLLGLSDMGAGEAVPAILPLLNDVELRVRQIALLSLGELAIPGSSEALERVCANLTADEPPLRYQALLAACQLAPTKAKEFLEKGVVDADRELRELALRLVGEILLQRGESLEGKLGERIVEACEDKDQGIRIVAQILAGELGWEAPRDMIAQIVRRRVKVCEARDEQMAVVLAGRLGLQELHASLSRRALGWFGFSLDPFRWVALGALLRLGDEDAWRRLSRALGSRRLMERTLAVQNLGASGDPRALSLLRELEGNEQAVDPEILSDALGRLNSEPATRP